MGLFGATEDSKLELIRGLIAERIRNDPNAKNSGLTPFAIRQLKSLTLLGTTEATIVTIAESVSELVRRGADEADAISKVENHRSAIGAGKRPIPTSLREYVFYRVEIEHSEVPLPKSHIDTCLHACAHFFEFVDDKGEAAHSIKYALLQEKTNQLESVLNISTVFLSGKMSHKAFSELMNPQIEAWSKTLEERKKGAALGAFMRHIRELDELDETVTAEPSQPLPNKMSPDEALKALAADFGEDFAELLCIVIDSRVRHFSRSQ